MDDNTAFVLVIVALCALWSVQAIARAWANRPRTCDCPCRRAADRPVDLGK